MGCGEAGGVKHPIKDTKLGGLPDLIPLRDLHYVFPGLEPWCHGLPLFFFFNGCTETPIMT